MTTRYLILSDIQYPFHSARAVKNVIRFIEDYKPDEIIGIGDALDYPQPSRWNQGTKGEFEQGVVKDSEGAKRDIFEPIRRVYDGPFGILESNHGIRPEEYLKKNAPALADVDYFKESKLLDYDGFGIKDLGKFYDLPGKWTATHGHLGFSLSRYAGGTAINAAKKIGRSVVCGHTHRLGLIGESKGYDGRGETLWGFETGNLMDIKKASYLKPGYGNWQMGFGILEWDGRTMQPRPVFVNPNGSFTFDGVEYK